MSGHSKWSTIKHKKEANDSKKGKVFSKYAQLISASAREGGGDLSMNPNLRLLVDKAKAESMPMANIDRAIARGTGEGADGPVIFEAISYEGFGPAGVTIMVDVLTENKNRAIADIRNIFSEYGGNLGEEGSVAWNYEQKGLIQVRCGKLVKAEKYGAPDTIMDTDKEKTMLDLMEVIGVLDISDAELDEGIGLDVYTKVEDMGKVRDEILKLGYIVISAELVRIPKMYKDYSDDDLIKIGNFLDVLDDYNDVQNIWTDVKPEDFKKLVSQE